jgi:hypothetical protein
MGEPKESKPKKSKPDNIHDAFVKSFFSRAVVLLGCGIFCAI